VAVICDRAQWPQVPTGRDNGTRSTSIAKGSARVSVGYTEDCIVQIRALGQKLVFDSEIELEIVECAAR